MIVFLFWYKILNSSKQRVFATWYTIVTSIDPEMIYPIRIFVLFHVFYVTGPKRVSNLQLTKLSERLDWSAQCELTNKNILPCLTCYF